MLDSLKLRREIFGIKSFFIGKEKDDIDIARAIEQYLEKNSQIKFHSAVSSPLIKYLGKADTSKNKKVSKDAGLRMFLKICKQYNQLSPIIKLLRLKVNEQPHEFTTELVSLINAPSLIDVLWERNWQIWELNELIDKEHKNLSVAKIKSLMKISEQLKNLKVIEEELHSFGEAHTQQQQEEQMSKCILLKFIREIELNLISNIELEKSKLEEPPQQLMSGNTLFFGDNKSPDVKTPNPPISTAFAEEPGVSLR